MLSRERMIRREDSVSGLGLAVTTVVAALLLILPVLQISYDVVRIAGVIVAGLLAGMIFYAVRQRAPVSPRSASLTAPTPPAPTWSDWVAMVRGASPWPNRPMDKEPRWSTGDVK